MKAADVFGWIANAVRIYLDRKAGNGSTPLTPAPLPAPPAPQPTLATTVSASPAPAAKGALKASDECLTLIKSFESCALKAYPDPLTKGPPFTCGWGATDAGIIPGTVWTQAQADDRLARDVEQFEAMVRRAVTHPMTQGQFDAFVSIFFNVGPGSDKKDGIARLKSGKPSTLLRMFNEGDIGGAEKQWTLWISPGSLVWRGLLRRRNAELVLFRRSA